LSRTHDPDLPSCGLFPGLFGLVLKISGNDLRCG
jgi:hypothetical protein